MTVDERVNILKNKLRRVSGRINDKITIIATTKKTANAFWVGIQRDLRKDYEVLRFIYRDWNTANLPLVYNEAIRKQIGKIKQLNIKPNKTIKYRTFMNANVNTQSISAILQESLSVMNIGVNSGEKYLSRLGRLTQQINIGEGQLNKFIEEGFTEGVTHKGKFYQGSMPASKYKLQQEMMKKALDGKYIVVMDKNGKEIFYKPDTYSEMVARTKMIESRSIATVNTTLGMGEDLVQVSSHNTTTPQCMVFEGKIYSISGTDKAFPPLADEPPFHPCCQHSLTTIIRDVLEDRGIQKYSDFSRGVTDIHPTRKSHVPVSKRNASWIKEALK